MVDENGFIIGINEVGIGSLGGAIPSNLARSVSKELAENGFISRCWTGIECQPVLNSNQEGLLVAGIIEDSPADIAGLKPGDLINSYDGKKVMARIAEDLPLFNQLSYSMPAGKKVKILGIRKNKKMSWVLTTASREPAYAKEKELQSWGITIRDFTLMSSLEARRSTKVRGPGALGWDEVGLPTVRSLRWSVEMWYHLNQRDSEVNGVNGYDSEFPKKLLMVQNAPIRYTWSALNGIWPNLLTVVKIGPEAEENQTCSGMEALVGGIHPSINPRTDRSPFHAQN